jgi:hemoglobin-like flavoprotein
MDQSNVEILGKTFDLASAKMDAFSIAFYRHLFISNPELRALFPEDMASLRRKLVQTLAMMVHRVDDPESLGSMLRNLGARHQAYGARSEHYAPVKHALIEAFSDTVGEEFDENARLAWTSMLDWVESQMLAGVSPAPY